MKTITIIQLVQYDQPGRLAVIVHFQNKSQVTLILKRGGSLFYPARSKDRRARSSEVSTATANESEPTKV